MEFKVWCAGRLPWAEPNEVETVLREVFSTSEEIVQVSASSAGFVFVTSDGKVFGSGFNDFKQLGIEDTRKVVAPQCLNFTIKAKNAFCGRNFTLIKNTEDVLLYCGCGDSSLREMTNLTSIEISVYENTLAIIDENHVLHFWASFNGQDPHVVINLDANTHQLHCGDHFCAFLNQGNVFRVSDRFPSVQPVSFSKMDNPRVKTLSASGHYMTAIDDTNAVWCEGIVHVASKRVINTPISHDCEFAWCMPRHLILRKPNGKYYAHGDNRCNQLLLGDKKSVYRPEEIDLPELVKDITGGETYTLFLTRPFDMDIIDFNREEFVPGTLGTPSEKAEDIIDKNTLP